MLSSRQAHRTNTVPAKFLPKGSFRGKIVVSIIERESGPERHLQFLVDLDRGQISEASDEELVRTSLTRGGHLDEDDCEKMVELPAPLDDLTVYCKKWGESYSVAIRHSKSSGEVQAWFPRKGWAIRGVIWSPDSKFIAVLQERERRDLSPLGLLALISGHPVPLETFKITLLSIRLDNELELPLIRRDSPSGWARFDWVP